MDKSEKNFELLDSILSRNLEWVAAADSKIAPLLAIDTALLGVLAALVPKSSDWLALPAIAASLCAILLIASLVCLVVANFPRLSGPKGSLIFFGGIAEYDRDTYCKKVSSGFTTELLQDYAYQCHRNAEIAKSKFHLVKWASILLFSSLPFFFVAISLLYNMK